MNYIIAAWLEDPGLTDTSPDAYYTGYIDSGMKYGRDGAFEYPTSEQAKVDIGEVPRKYATVKVIPAQSIGKLYVFTDRGGAYHVVFAKSRSEADAILSHTCGSDVDLDCVHELVDGLHFTLEQ